MEKTYKVREGNYEKEEDVVINVTTKETQVVETTSVFSVGDIKKKIQDLSSQIESLTEEKTQLESLISETRSITTEAVEETKTNE
jgi:hypothetical protein